MTTPVFHRSDVETPLWATASTETIVQEMQRINDESVRAVRIAHSAAGASRRMHFFVPAQAGWSNSTLACKIRDVLASNSRSSFAATDLLMGHSATLEAAQFRSLFEDMVQELVSTKSALTQLATSVTRELVGEPGKLVSGNELAQMLGISEEAVRQRHQAGKLIAILTKGRERGRGFPIFQAWEGIAGATLEQVLKAIGYDGPGSSVDAADAFQFFVSRNELLGGFTPVEVLTGAGLPDPEDIEAAEFLAKPYQERLEFVTNVARSLAEARDA